MATDTKDFLFGGMFCFTVWAIFATFAYFFSSEPTKPVFYFEEPKCILGICLDFPREVVKP